MSYKRAMFSCIAATAFLLCGISPASAEREARAATLQELETALRDGAHAIAVTAPIRLDGTLVIRDAALRGTSPDAALRGGAVRSLGNSSLESLFIEAPGGFDAAVEVAEGTLLLRDAHIAASGGAAGAAVLAGASLYLEDSSVTGGGDALRVHGEARIAGTTLQGGPDGHALRALNADVTATGTGFNSGGFANISAAHQRGGTLRIENSVLQGSPALEALEGGAAVLDNTDLYAQGDAVRAQGGARVEIWLDGAVTVIADGGDGGARGRAEALRVPDRLEIELGSSEAIAAEALPEGAALPELTWSSDDARVAEADTQGVVYARGIGTCRVTARGPDGLIGQTDVRVTERKAPGASGQETRRAAAPAPDIVATRADEAEVPGVPVYIVREDGAPAYGNPYAAPPRVGALERGRLLLPSAGGNGDPKWLAVLHEGRTAFMRAEALERRSLEPDTAGASAVLLREALAVGLDGAEGVLLPAGTPVRTLLTVGESTAVLAGGGIAYLPSSALRLAPSGGRSATVHAAGWTPLYEYASLSAPVRSRLRQGVQIEIASSSEAAEGWLYVRAGKTVGYIEARHVSENAEP